MTILQTKDLRKIYGAGETEVRALDGVDLTVEKGEFVAVVGTSGSGKSTLLHMLGGLDRPTSGSVTVDGREIFSLKDEALTIFRRRKIGFVFQNYNLVPVLNVYENIVLPIQLDGKEPDQGYLDQIIATLSLEKKLQSLPNNLSGGQQQRVAIARALVNRPKVLLLDEPLGALDLRLRKDMQIELKRIQQQMGITFIYVTHDQEEALTMSDTVVVMDKGRIQQIGTPEDIYNEPKNAFVADFIGESNILNGTMVRDNVVKMYGKEFPCVDGGFAPNEPVDVVIRPEDIDIVPVEQGQLVGTVTNVTFKGMQYDIIVDFRGFKWLIQTTDHSPVGARIGVKIDPDGFHIMKKSEYSGQFGDYSSYSEEYEELADASWETDEEESGDEE